VIGFAVKSGTSNRILCENERIRLLGPRGSEDELEAQDDVARSRNENRIRRRAWAVSGGGDSF
jgi:hypothetical protein